jgi:hypothetical protein
MARRRINFGSPNINTSAATAWSELLSLAMRLDAQKQENKWRTAETEASRKHSESLIYLRDLLQDQNRLDQQGFKLRSEARDVGILETALNKIQDDASITEGSKNYMLPRKEKLESEISIQQRDNSIIEKELNLYSLGYNIANTLDTNFDSELDAEELATYVKKEHEGELPKSIKSGLDNWFLDPSRREKVIANAKTEEILMSLNKMHPGNKHLQAAKVLYEINPSDPKVKDQITKAITTQEDPVDNLKKNLEATDITFRNYMEGLESARQGVQDTFLKGLPIQGTEDYKAKSLTDPNFVTSFRKDLGSNFATWFSGETREGEDYSSSPIDWIKDTFDAEGGWKDIDNSVPQVMADSRWQELISNPEKLEDAFEWTGFWKNEAEEEAANNFFLKAVELYNTVDKIEGNVNTLSPEFYDKLGGQKIKPTVPVDSTITPTVITPQAPVDSTFMDQSQMLKQFESETKGYKKLPLHGYFEEKKEAIRNLEDIAYFDPNTPPNLAANLKETLDLLGKESQLNELVFIINNSPNIRNEFAQTGQSVDILKIIEKWKRDGYPDIGDFVMDEFPNVEPEFIR